MSGVVPRLIAEKAALLADEPALLAPGRAPLGFDGLAAQIARTAEQLAHFGVAAGDRVALVLDNGPEMATACLGVTALATCAPLNPACQAPELRFYLHDTRASTLIVLRGADGPARGVADELGLRVIELEPSEQAGTFCLSCAAPGRPAPRREVVADDVALILHTSGTTSRPKIVPLSQANLCASARNIAAFLGLSPADRCLNVMPLFHIHGLIGVLLSSLAGGASVICTPGFDELRFFEWTAELSPTWYSAVPTMHQALLAQGERYRACAPEHRFRFVRSSSAALAARTCEQLEALFDAPVIEAYGMTEAAHQMASNPLPPAMRKPGTVGIPAGVEIALIDERGELLRAGGAGEIVIRGPSVTAGYEANPEANQRSFSAGWFRTGDQGRFDADGYLTIVGRLKEIVNRGGEKISPREVDDVLLEHPDVQQAFAFGIPHDSLGEDLAAAVVLHAGATADEASLRAFAFERLADFKVPSLIAIVDVIPKGSTGKVQRTSLHEKLRAQLAVRFVEPRNDTEAKLGAIFAEVLGHGPIGVADNFFAVGGDSLKGLQIVSRVYAGLGIELPVAALFRYPTVAALATKISEAIAARDAELKALETEIAGLSDDEIKRLLEQEKGQT